MYKKAPVWTYLQLRQAEPRWSGFPALRDIRAPCSSSSYLSDGGIAFACNLCSGGIRGNGRALVIGS